jgi:hypothetical protein
LPLLISLWMTLPPLRFFDMGTGARRGGGRPRQILLVTYFGPAPRRFAPSSSPPPTPFRDRQEPPLGAVPLPDRENRPLPGAGNARSAQETRARRCAANDLRAAVFTSANAPELRTHGGAHDGTCRRAHADEHMDDSLQTTTRERTESDRAACSPEDHAACWSSGSGAGMVRWMRGTGCSLVGCAS